MNNPLISDVLNRMYTKVFSVLIIKFLLVGTVNKLLSSTIKNKSYKVLKNDKPMPT